MSQFATGVTVVTTAVDGRLHGFTANAVTSVSLDPLLFLVCVGKGANAHRELERAESFGVSILAAEQVDVSNTFAKSEPPAHASLRGVRFKTGETGVPLIEDCLAWLECRVHQRVDAGDHTLVLGRVLAGSLGKADPPLLFFRGRYTRPAD
jgi:flavin reductase (DIM6/NTAB) family NADH-FMN oxidoreductase RutF